jgi:hypothetical protein
MFDKDPFTGILISLLLAPTAADGVNLQLYLHLSKFLSK